MLAGHIPGATRILGKSQGYDALPIRDAMVIGGAKQYPVMTSAWLPEHSDLVQLNRGASIYVTLMGDEHPPMRVVTGNVPDKYTVRMNTELDLIRCGLNADEAHSLATKLLAQGFRIAPLTVQK